MKITATMNDREYSQIESYISCSDWGNPMQDEYVFYDPSEAFLVILALFDIPYHIEEVK